ncbi:MAG: dynamin family protein [Phototrophicaceae bacterium]
MATENTNTQLLLDYEAIRRQELQLIQELLDITPRIENLPPDRVAQLRDALFHADTPYLAVFVGPFSSGKSSLINALLGTTDLLRVGPTPTTDRINIIRWGEAPDSTPTGSDVETIFHPSPLLKKVSIVDTPGLESVFKDHENTTQRFLHRSDSVFMVMLATQAMTASNLEALKHLREYGKNIILLINQSDLLSADEQKSVREYVQDQSQSKLGYKPEVWMVSALHGLNARKTSPLDEALWRQSGLDRLEKYINDQLGDVARLRQKLQTPLQIVQNTNQAALTAVRGNQAVFDQYSGIAENIRAQIAAQARAQTKTIQETKDQISTRFGEASLRGSEAIRDLFGFSRALSAVGRGVLELFRLGGLLRAGGVTQVDQAFSARKALEPIDALNGHVDSLAGRVEGRDLQDCDNLLDHSQKQLAALPEAMRARMIGTLKPPQGYDRSFLTNARDELESIEREARKGELVNLDDTLRNTVVYLAIYEVILLLFTFVLVYLLVAADGTQTVGILLGAILALMLFGLAFVPLRGRLLEGQYSRQMLKYQTRYLDRLSAAMTEQMAHGVKLREQVADPLLSLIESQTDSQRQQLQALQNIQQQATKIESSLNQLGKWRLLS